MSRRKYESLGDVVIDLIARIVAVLIMALISSIIWYCSTIPAGKNEYKLVAAIEHNSSKVTETRFICQKIGQNYYIICDEHIARVGKELGHVPEGYELVAATAHQVLLSWDERFYCVSQNDQSIWLCTLGEKPELRERVKMPEGVQLVGAYGYNTFFSGKVTILVGIDETSQQYVSWNDGDPLSIRAVSNLASDVNVTAISNSKYSSESPRYYGLEGSGWGRVSNNVIEAVAIYADDYVRTILSARGLAIMIVTIGLLIVMIATLERPDIKARIKNEWKNRQLGGITASAVFLAFIIWTLWGILDYEATLVQLGVAAALSSIAITGCMLLILHVPNRKIVQPVT